MDIREEDRLSRILKGPQEMSVVKPGGEVQGLGFLSKSQDIISLKAVEDGNQEKCQAAFHWP